MKNLVYSDTLQDYIEKERLIWASEPELKDQPFDPIMLNIKGEHYAKVCEHCKHGGTITKEVYNSLDSINQYHFTKHYNHRGDHFNHHNTEIMKNDNSEKVAFLQSLGFTDVEDNGDNISFEGDCQMSIDVEDIKMTDTHTDIERKADKYSCCGDILDEDYMICTTCKEHC